MTLSLYIIVSRHFFLSLSIALALLFCGMLQDPGEITRECEARGRVTVGCFGAQTVRHSRNVRLGHIPIGF